MYTRIRLLAIAVVVVFVALLVLYVREFPVFSNTIGVGRLVFTAVFFALVLSGVVLWRFRARFSPAENHLPEIAALVILPALFMPLFASLFNRAGGPNGYESFRFVAERPYIAERYGILGTDSLKATGFFLIVERDERQYQFRYTEQPYYPITRLGEEVLLPVKSGLLGFRVVLLR